MNKLILPGTRQGAVKIPASKSQAHRALICAALSRSPVTLRCDGISDDIAATAGCIRSLGGGAVISGESIAVSPVTAKSGGTARLDVRESGSTLRFLLPLAGALGQSAEFHMSGRLPDRPLAPLDARLREHGMSIERRDSILFCSGQLRPGRYEMPGDVSSQYITGLLFALPLLDGDSELIITSPVESTGYIDMTLDMIKRSGVSVVKNVDGYIIPGRQSYHMPGTFTVEGDWSSAAFMLCTGAMSEQGITVTGLDSASHQGDRAILDILARAGAQIELSDGAVTVKKPADGGLRGQTVDGRMIPDIVPVLSVVAAACAGTTRFVNAGRLRLKESDRIRSTVALIRSLGGSAAETEDGLVVEGSGKLRGGTTDSFNDHRIAMSAAVAACICAEPVIITNPDCIAKSYPRFWEDFEGLEVIR